LKGLGAAEKGMNESSIHIDIIEVYFFKPARW